MKGQRAYTQDEYENLKQIAKPREKCLIILGVRTGFRISELLSLDIEDISIDMIHLKKKNTKGKTEGCHMPLHPEAVVAIKEYIKERTKGPIFLSRDRRRLGRISAWVALSKVQEEAGIKDGVSTHSLRKSFAKRFHQASGGDLFKLQKALRHTSVATTIKYLQIDSEEIGNLIKNLK